MGGRLSSVLGLTKDSLILFFSECSTSAQPGWAGWAGDASKEKGSQWGLAVRDPQASVNHSSDRNCLGRGLIQVSFIIKTSITFLKIRWKPQIALTGKFPTGVSHGLVMGGLIIPDSNP